MPHQQEILNKALLPEVVPGAVNQGEVRHLDDAPAVRLLYEGLVEVERVGARDGLVAVTVAVHTLRLEGGRHFCDCPAVVRF